VYGPRAVTYRLAVHLYVALQLPGHRSRVSLLRAIIQWSCLQGKTGCKRHHGGEQLICLRATIVVCNFCSILVTMSARSSSSSQRRCQG
jgi:hypothetical protein